MRGAAPVHVVERLDHAGQEAAAQRRVGDEADAKFACRAASFLRLGAV